MLNKSSLCCLSVLAVMAPLAGAGTAAPQAYAGDCDGSAVVYVGNQYFVNANDENNFMRLYKLGREIPKNIFDGNKELGIKPNKKGEFKEVDIEGVARVGSRLYWIGSHGNDRKAKREPDRERLFATELTGRDENASLKLVGKPYTGLLDDFSRLQAPYGALFATARTLAPKQGGISIEGLAAAGPEGLLIGFRSPLTHEGRAVVLPLLNAAAVVNSGAAPRFGPPYPLDLQERGIRAIEPKPKAEGVYWVLAGPAGDKDEDEDKDKQKGQDKAESNAKPFALYEWRPAGEGSLKQLDDKDLDLSAEDGNPEGLLVDDAGRLMVARDGGEFVNVPGGGKTVCKDQPPASRSFDLRPAWREPKNGR